MRMMVMVRRQMLIRVQQKVVDPSSVSESRDPDNQAVRDEAPTT